MPNTNNHHTLFERYIRQYMAHHKLSMTALANKAGIARSSLYHMFEPSHKIQSINLLKLAQAMGVHYSILFRLKHPDFTVETNHDSQKPTSILTEVYECGYDKAGFIDETLPKGALILAGTPFEASWVLQNIGAVTWENRFLLCSTKSYQQNMTSSEQMVNGNQLSPQVDKIPIATTKPSECVTITAKFIAPTVTGRYVCYWKMVDDQNNLCFQKGNGLLVSILVRSFAVGQHYPW